MVLYNDDKLTLAHLADFKRILNKIVREEDNYGKQYRMDILRDLISRYSL